jgi:hypothetical protein
LELAVDLEGEKLKVKYKWEIIKEGEKQAVRATQLEIAASPLLAELPGAAAHRRESEEWLKAQAWHSGDVMTIALKNEYCARRLRDCEATRTDIIATLLDLAQGKAAAIHNRDKPSLSRIARMLGDIEEGPFARVAAGKLAAEKDFRTGAEKTMKGFSFSNDRIEESIRDGAAFRDR